MRKITQPLHIDWLIKLLSLSVSDWLISNTWDNVWSFHPLDLLIIQDSHFRLSGAFRCLEVGVGDLIYYYWICIKICCNFPSYPLVNHLPRQQICILKYFLHFYCFYRTEVRVLRFLIRFLGVFEDGECR